jgi:Ca-activated chloride channel homolog
MKPSRPVLFCSILVILILVTGTWSAGSSISRGQSPPEMVILNVRVTDSMSKAVSDVPRENFQILEDGLVQNITYFSSAQVPLSYGLVIDTSGSLRDQLRAVIKAGLHIVNSNKSDDETFLIRFISSDKIETVQATTSDKGLLMNGLQSLYVEGGQTAIIDAVYLSVDLLVKQKHSAGSIHRKALVLVTDGEDRLSYYKIDQLLGLLAKTDIQIYAIGFIDQLSGGIRNKAKAFLTRLADETGGRVFFPKSSGDLESISVQIVNDIRTQYVIGYVPSGTDSKKDFHKLQVLIAGNEKQDKRIAVTRLGYSRAGK